MKVLLVDDERIQLRGLSRHVAWDKIGYEMPDCADSGALAIRMAMETQYDVIVADVTMPQMTGLEMIKEMRKCLQKQPVFVILSGYDEFSYAQEAIRLGVRYYALKPVKVEEITEVLQNVYLEINGMAAIGEEDAAERVHPVIFQIIQYIEKEYASPVTTQSLAERFGLNSSYLSTLFKQNIGMNLSVYLTKTRMKKAVELLKTGRYRISDISEMVGYRTPAYFAEQFKKEYGCNPKDYRFEK